jgi:RimJ/RimL family protein N-acetyltransferase
VNETAAAPTPPPAGYPQGYEYRILLRDGRHIWLRPVGSDDGRAILRFVRSLSLDDIRQRWMSRAPLLTDEEILARTVVDYRDDFVVTAWSMDGELAGTASYRRLRNPGSSSAAVLGIAVDPSWRRVGLAREMLWLAAARADECGIEQFSATWTAGNQAAERLAQLAGAYAVGYTQMRVCSVLVSALSRMAS